MKKAFLVFAMVLTSQAAMADHSLLDAMSRQDSIRTAVEVLLEKNSDLTCVLDKSMQMPPSKKLASEHSGNVWRQVAVCFERKEEAAKFSQAGSNIFGGIYGFMSSAILDITYNQDTGRVIKASLK